MGESLLTENPGNLPPLWHTLYYEGIRGHHVLFAPSDIQKFESKNALFRFSGEQEREDFAGLVSEFLKKSSLVDMRLFIQQQPDAMREALYRFYKGWLRRWADHLKSVLH